MLNVLLIMPAGGGLRICAIVHHCLSPVYSSSGSLSMILRKGSSVMAEVYVRLIIPVWLVLPAGGGLCLIGPLCWWRSMFDWSSLLVEVYIWLFLSAVQDVHLFVPPYCEGLCFIHAPCWSKSMFDCSSLAGCQVTVNLDIIRQVGQGKPHITYKVARYRHTNQPQKKHL